MKFKGFHGLISSFLMLVVMTALVACSSAKQSPDSSGGTNSSSTSSSSGEPGVDSGSDPGTSSSSTSSSSSSSSGEVVDAGKDATPNQEQCLADCQTKHPQGTALNANVDKCFADFCSPMCTQGAPTGQTFGPNQKNDAGAVADCSYPVVTFSTDCSNCVVAKCCAPWVQLYTAPDGLALAQCSDPCWALPHAPQQ